MFLELSEGAATEDDLPDDAADALADSGIPCQVRLFPDEFLDAFGEIRNCLRCAPVRPRFVRIVLLRRQQLRKTQKAVRDICVGQRRLRCSGMCPESTLPLAFWESQFRMKTKDCGCRRTEALGKGAPQRRISISPFSRREVRPRRLDL
jgi:hypothetical protein